MIDPEIVDDGDGPGADTKNTAAVSAMTAFGRKLHESRSVREGLVEKALLLYYVMRDQATPLWAKTAIAGALAIHPAGRSDPGFHPVAGFTDDLGALVVIAKVLGRCKAPEKCVEPAAPATPLPSSLSLPAPPLRAGGFAAVPLLSASHHRPPSPPLSPSVVEECINSAIIHPYRHEKLLRTCGQSSDVRYEDLENLCTAYFGPPDSAEAATPSSGHPEPEIPRQHPGRRKRRAKTYQVRRCLQRSIAFFAKVSGERKAKTRERERKEKGEGKGERRKNEKEGKNRR